jgi:tetratricopeptide (TPR) repeat protein
MSGGRWFIAFVAVVLLCGAAAGDPVSRFDEGLRLYRSGDMDGAIGAWENLVRQGTVSGALLYNLGNAYYKTGKIGKAILYFERAQRLLPRDGDVDSNLDLARLATVDRIESPVRLVVWHWVDSVRDYFSLPELATVLQVVGFVGLAIFLTWRIGPTVLGRWLRPALVILIAAYAVAGAWYLWRADLEARGYGIVMATKTDVYSAPEPASKQLFSLHEGTKLRCGESLSGWINIRLADGRQGWMPVQNLEKI